MNIEEYIIPLLLPLASGMVAYLYKRFNQKLNSLENKIDNLAQHKVSKEDMQTYVNDKHSAIIRDIDEQRDRMIAMAAQINRIMELLIEIKNGKK